MGITTVDIKVCRIDKPELCKTVRNVVVDTGSTVTAVPSKVVKELGIQLPLKRKFLLANGRSVVKQVGFALIEFDGRRTSDDVIAISKGNPLLSVRALEGMGLQVDPRSRRLKKMQGSFLL